MEKIIRTKENRGMNKDISIPKVIEIKTQEDETDMSMEIKRHHGS
jgi:hypothetical protein